MSKPSIIKTKILPTLIALIFLFGAVLQLIIPLLGKETSAREIKRDIVRRDRDEHPDLQFVWEIQYEYFDSKGDRHTGAYDQNGNATGSNVHAPRSVFYLTFLPNWKVVNSNAGTGNIMAGLVSLGAGILILYATFNKGGKRRNRKRAKQKVQPQSANYPNQHPAQRSYQYPGNYANRLNNPNQAVTKQWQCPRCNKINQGNFCNNCGFPNPDQSSGHFA